MSFFSPGGTERDYACNGRKSKVEANEASRLEILSGFSCFAFGPNIKHLGTAVFMPK